MRCPICRAEQEWSDSCRRCRGDLRLLRACRDRLAELALGCFQALAENRPAEAHRLASELLALDPSLESQRLFAASAFANGDYAAAVRAASAALAAEASANESPRFAPRAPAPAPVAVE